MLCLETFKRQLVGHRWEQDAGLGQAFSVTQYEFCCGSCAWIFRSYCSPPVSFLQKRCLEMEEWIDSWNSMLLGKFMDKQKEKKNPFHVYAWDWLDGRQMLNPHMQKLTFQADTTRNDSAFHNCHIIWRWKILNFVPSGGDKPQTYSILFLSIFCLYRRS